MMFWVSVFFFVVSAVVFLRGLWVEITEIAEMKAKVRQMIKR